ncbi:hypothetical protein BASA83_006625 [Batrachochytrium salamandrivorans]|nr:hypothetical protein BASA83_006625 [Batrachochytrium salamandrivorans]
MVRQSQGVFPVKKVVIRNLRAPANHHHLPLLDIRPCTVSITTSVLSRSNPGSPDGACLQDRPPHHKTRCSISHNGPRRPTTQHHPASSAKASKPTGVFGKTTDIAVRPASTNAPPPPLSRQILAVNVANISNKRTCYPPYRQEQPGSGPSQRPASLHLISLYCPWIRCHPASQPRDLDAEESPSDILEPPPTTVRREAFASIRQSLDRVVPFDNNHPVLIFGDWNTNPQRLQRIFHSWGHGLTVMQFSGSQITRLDSPWSDLHSSIDHFVCSSPARALLTSPPTRFNRRLISGTTKRAILTSNTARQAFISAATNLNPDPVQCNTLRDEWSRLKAAATQLERVDGRKQWVKHADNLDRAVSDGPTDLVFSAARAMSGNSSRSAAVTPLYNSDGIVQYDPTSILRVMQGPRWFIGSRYHRSLADLQYWHDRQPIQASSNTPPIRNSTFSTRISRESDCCSPFCR